MAGGTRSVGRAGLPSWASLFVDDATAVIRSEEPRATGAAALWVSSHALLAWILKPDRGRGALYEAVPCDDGVLLYVRGSHRRTFRPILLSEPDVDGNGALVDVRWNGVRMSDRLLTMAGDDHLGLAVWRGDVHVYVFPAAVPERVPRRHGTRAFRHADAAYRVVTEPEQPWSVSTSTVVYRLPGGVVGVTDWSTHHDITMDSEGYVNKPTIESIDHFRSLRSFSMNTEAPRAIGVKLDVDVVDVAAAMRGWIEATPTPRSGS